MTRTENDLRDALHDLDRRAAEHGAPSAASILTHTDDDQLGRHRESTTSRSPRWLAPLAAAAVVAAAAVAVTVFSNGSSNDAPAAGQPTQAPTPAQSASIFKSEPLSRVPAGATVLEDAATKLDAAPWSTPAPDKFFYRRTTDVTSWTSVSGKKAGEARTSDGNTTAVPGCRNGHIVSSGQSGTCTLKDVPHYLADAPAKPAAWDAYLERMAPGAKAGGAQGKIIVQVLHEDLTAPTARAALLRYTETCPGLNTFSVAPVTGEKLVGVTCTSMTAGSYALVFDASTHALAGFVVVTSRGAQDGPAEIVRETGIVTAIGRTP